MLSNWFVLDRNLPQLITLTVMFGYLLLTSWTISWFSFIWGVKRAIWGLVIINKESLWPLWLGCKSTYIGFWVTDKFCGDNWGGDFELVVLELEDSSEESEKKIGNKKLRYLSTFVLKQCLARPSINTISLNDWKFLFLDWGHQWINHRSI